MTQSNILQVDIHLNKCIHGVQQQLTLQYYLDNLIYVWLNKMWIESRENMLLVLISYCTVSITEFL